jgi:hypothetical protein
MGAAYNADAHARREYAWTALAFLAALGALVMEDWLATSSYRSLEDLSWIGSHRGWLAVVTLILTCGLAWWVTQLHRREPRPKGRQIIPQATGLLLLLFTGNWCAIASERWLMYSPLHMESHPMRFAFLALAGLALFSWTATSLRDRLMHPRNLAPKKLHELAAERHPRVLILFVSTPSFVPELATDPAKQGFHFRLTSKPSAGGQIANRVDLSGKSLTSDINAISAFQTAANEIWNWQQLLRALQHHQRLETVWLIGSSNAANFVPADDHLKPGHRCNVRAGQGSAAYLHGLARPILQAYTSAAVEVWDSTADFEDFNNLVKILRELLARSLHDLPPSDIFVDVTGGQKTASIAAATLTLNRELRFQYVQTNAPYETLTYDLVYHSPPEPHGHFPRLGVRRYRSKVHKASD